MRRIMRLTRMHLLYTPPHYHYCICFHPLRPAEIESSMYRNFGCRNLLNHHACANTGSALQLVWWSLDMDGQPAIPC